MPTTIEVRFDSRREIDEIERARRMSSITPALRESVCVEPARRALEQIERVNCERRLIEMYVRGQSPLDLYDRIARSAAEIEAARNQLAFGPAGRWPGYESLADLERRNEFLERALRREMIMLLCRGL